MKMTKEHYEAMKKTIKAYLAKYPISAGLYKKKNWSKTRFAWDLYHHVPGVKTPKHYEYLNDAHIETALFRIVGKY